MKDNTVEKIAKDFAVDYYVFAKMCEMGYYDDKGDLKESATSTAPIVSLLGEAEEELETVGGKMFLSFLRKRLSYLLTPSTPQTTPIGAEGGLEGKEVYEAIPLSETTKNGEYLIVTGKSTITDEKAKMEFTQLYLKKVTLPSKPTVPSDEEIERIYKLEEFILKNLRRIWQYSNSQDNFYDYARKIIIELGLSKEYNGREDDYEPSSNNSEASPVASHSCTDSNSIEQLARDKAQELFDKREAIDGFCNPVYFEGVKDGYKACFDDKNSQRLL